MHFQQRSFSFPSIFKGTKKQPTWGWLVKKTWRIRDAFPFLSLFSICEGV
jgi:hypothetical protein